VTFLHGEVTSSPAAPVSLVASEFFSENEHRSIGTIEGVAGKEALIFVAGVGVRDRGLVRGRSTRKGRQIEAVRGETPRMRRAGRDRDLGTMCRMRLRREADGVGDASRAGRKEAKQESNQVGCAGAMIEALTW
jgi:hypothetical protein